MSYVDRHTFIDQLWSRRGVDSAIDCDWNFEVKS